MEDTSITTEPIAAHVARVEKPAGASYREALKATSITGASSIVEVLVHVVRSKVVAVCVGPGGIGLLGVLGSTTGLVGAIVGMGLNGSGVRQVAAANAINDTNRIARVIYTLRRSSLALGLVGTVLVLAFAGPIARVSVGSEEYARYLVLLAPLILFQTVNGGQTALLRGLRRIATLARLRILGAVLGTTFAIPLVLLWGLDGIPPALLVTAAAALAASWWYARQVTIPPVTLGFAELRGELSGLFGLGVAFMLTGLQASAVQYGLRTILVHETSLDTVGQFLAAAALSHVYVGFVLQAMGLDYLPRLTRLTDDPVACNRLVNEQTEIALLLAVPGVVALMVLAPVVIPILYSGRFTGAIEVFRWQCLGVLLKVASWPVGFVLVARGMKGTFFFTETSTNLFYLVCFYLMSSTFGLTGAAMSYAMMYIFCLILVFVLVRRATGFSWSAPVRKVILTAGASLAAALAATSWLRAPWSLLAGTAVVVATALWAYRELCTRLELPLARAVVAKVGVLTQRFRGRAGASKT